MDRDAGFRSLEALERLWHERRGDRPLPGRRDFAFEDFKPWLGHIRIVQVEHGQAEHEPLRFKVALDGTEIVATAGVDLTGKYLDTVYGSDSLRFLLDGYHPCVREKRPVYETLHPNGRIVNFGEIIRILLPCGQEERVDHILYCEYAFDVWHWGKTVFANLKDLKM